MRLLGSSASWTIQIVCIILCTLRALRLARTYRALALGLELDHFVAWVRVEVELEIDWSTYSAAQLDSFVELLEQLFLQRLVRTMQSHGPDKMTDAEELEFRRRYVRERIRKHQKRTVVLV
eukprot:m.888690 g.888690  ORF g.888690 m.888690 type:complete len:121 (-) comp59935_c0_seq1:3760-4122(-)